LWKLKDDKKEQKIKASKDESSLAVKGKEIKEILKWDQLNRQNGSIWWKSMSELLLMEQYIC